MSSDVTLVHERLHTLADLHSKSGNHETASVYRMAAETIDNLRASVRSSERARQLENENFRLRLHVSILREALLPFSRVIDSDEMVEDRSIKIGHFVAAKRAIDRVKRSEEEG